MPNHKKAPHPNFGRGASYVIWYNERSKIGLERQSDNVTQSDASKPTMLCDNSIENQDTIFWPSL